MPRIPDEELVRIKRETDLPALVRESGVELARHGKDWLGLCPWHRDRDPSLVVSPDKGLWQCMGACRTGGSALDWVMKSRGVGFREAAELLQRRLGTAPIEAPSPAAALTPAISEGERG
jgi:DNA primase